MNPVQIDQAYAAKTIQSFGRDKCVIIKIRQSTVEIRGSVKGVYANAVWTSAADSHRYEFTAVEAPQRECLPQIPSLFVLCIDFSENKGHINNGGPKMANLNIRVDDTLKEQAEAVLSYIGLSLSAATTIFLKQVVHSNGIPFELRADPFYFPENQARLRASIKQMEETGGTVHELIEVEDD
jgi:DNA-damage-inducible protein J